MPAARPPVRCAFTLMELLVVIGVILLLVAMTMPIIGMIRRQARDALCRNNLQQIGIGITGFQQVNGNKFPATFASLFITGGVMEGESPKLLLCPFDDKKGKSHEAGRPPSWGVLEELYQPECSYLFEAADVPMIYPLSPPNGLPWKFAQDPGNIVGWDINGPTWADAKVYALKHDNLGGKPFRLSDFPIVRCFWHAKWPASSSNATEKRVLNLAWDMSLFWSIPEWETQMRGN